MQSDEEKRHFVRFEMDSEATLSCGDQQWDSTLSEISLKGALIKRPEDFDLTDGAVCNLDVKLFQSDTVISMEVALCHTSETHLGFCCQHIDLESISHLRRMVELNLGDEEELERELHDLIH